MNVVQMTDTKNTDTLLEIGEVGDQPDDNLVDNLPDTAAAHSNQITKVSIVKLVEVNALSSNDHVTVKCEPLAIELDQLSKVECSVSENSVPDLISKEVSDEKTEITELVLMNSKDLTTVQLSGHINNVSSNVCRESPESEDTFSDQHSASYQIFLGPWKNHEVEKTLSDNKAIRFKCLKCEFFTSSGMFLKDHYKSSHLHELFSCDECLILFISRKNLTKHNFLHHQQDRQWKCLRCNYSTKQYNSLRKHRKKHAKPLLCVECNSNFSSSAQLQCHMLKFHAEKADSSHTHKCYICGAVYALRCSFEKHMHKHFGIRPYSCNYCDYKCTIKKNVVRHEMTKHFFPTKLRCPYCSRKFYDQKTFEEHKINHLVHQCHLCSVKESSWRNLVKHCKNMHGKKALKPLQCKICLRRFSYKCSLRRHSCKKLVRKNMVQSLECPNCQTKYSYKSSLTRHLKFCNQKKKYEKVLKRNDCGKPLSNGGIFKCSACNEQFPKMRVLKRHLEFCVFSN